MKKLRKIVYSSIAVCIAATALCGYPQASAANVETNLTAITESGIHGSDYKLKLEQAEKAIVTAIIHKDAKFDSAELNLNADDFTAAGFSLGDSMNVAFSNGLTLTDIPYFNGYYVNEGKPVVVAYPGHDYVLIANRNTDFWTPHELKDGMTVNIKLNTKAKYLATQQAIGQRYSIERADFASDEVFANFRALQGGNLKADFLYRGASPVDNSRNRAPYANGLIEKHHVACIIDLADSDEDMSIYFKKNGFRSDYAKKLYEKSRTIPLDMDASYAKPKYKQSVAKGLCKLLEVGGPAYIHCLEGKDRTGFVCMLIEALAGASYEEMRDDYMTTYANYYHMTPDGTPHEYHAVVALYFDPFMEYLSGESDTAKLHVLSYTDYARQYLLDGGMTATQIDELLSLITK